MTTSSSQPLVISVQAVKHAYFIDQDTHCSISLCTPDQFRVFIASIAPATWTDTDARSVLAQETLDDMDKWFVLSVLEKRLASSGHYLPLFTDRSCLTALKSKYDAPKSKNALRGKSGRAKTDQVQVVDSKSPKRAKRVRSKTNIAS